MNKMIETKIYIGCNYLYKNIEFYLVVKNEKLFILQQNTETQKEFLLEVSSLNWENHRKELNLETKTISDFWNCYIGITTEAVNILNKNNEQFYGYLLISSANIEHFIKNHFTQSVNML